MLPATGYCGEDRYPVSNQIPQHTSVIIPTNRNHEVPLIKSGASGEQVSKHLIWENTQPNDNKLNSPAQNATSPSGQPTQFKHTQNSNKEASLKHRKLISSRLECFGGPSSSKSRQIPQHQSIPNANDGFYPDDVKGMFFKSAVAGVFGLGSKKHKKSPKASSGKHGSPVLGSNVP
ncbi:unnamed protein product [Trichobilharzia regenti]|nr:unnamed protein product [Trichobilharzia regenti]